VDESKAFTTLQASTKNTLDLMECLSSKEKEEIEDSSRENPNLEITDRQK